MVSSDEMNLHKKRLIVKLLKGRKIATQLKTLIQNPTEEHGGIVSVEELTLQVSRSITEILNELESYTGSAESNDHNTGVDFGGDTSSVETKKIKDRRGCYNRRKTTDSWTEVSQTTEDRYGWRKYGQKTIKNSEFHRCYYRCTHKVEGCKALKQVQKIKNDPVMYQITYFHQHTCNKNTLIINAPPLIVDSEPVDHNLISFRADNNIRNIKFPMVKQESKQHSTTHHDLREDDYQCPPSDRDAKPRAAESPRQADLIGLEALGSYNPVMMVSSYHKKDNNHQEVASGFGSTSSLEALGSYNPVMMVSSYHEKDNNHQEVASGFGSSSGSTCMNGLDMEVNQLGDFDSFHCFDDVLVKHFMS